MCATRSARTGFPHLPQYRARLPLLFFPLTHLPSPSISLLFLPLLSSLLLLSLVPFLFFFLLFFLPSPHSLLFLPLFPLSSLLPLLPSLLSFLSCFFFLHAPLLLHLLL